MPIKKKRKKLNNRKKIKPISPMEKLNRLKNGFFESDETPDFVGTTKPNEFSLLDGSIVPSGVRYHIDYDGEKKRESYFTGRRFTSESKGMIRLKNETDFGQYKRLKGSLKTQTYFVPYVFNPQNKDFKRGFSYRFFARQRFGDKKVIEISDTDYKRNSPMYTTIETRWYVGDNKLNNEIQNPLLVEKLVEMGFVELENLNPMEGYTGPDDEQIRIDSLQELKSQNKVQKKKKKFSVSKGNKRRRRGGQTSTTRAPAQGGGGGGSAY